MKRSAVFAVLVAVAAPLVACTPSPPSRAPVEKAPPTLEPVRSPASPAPSGDSAKRLAPAEVPIGLAAPFAAPVPAAVAKNEVGVGLLAKGKFAEARLALDAAVALDPSFVLARYNRACAEARAGDFAAAARDMTAVYDVDFVGSRAHAEHDADLTAFWASAEGGAVTAKVPAYEARYQRVIDRGLRALLWAGGGGRVQPTVLRVGVFDVATQRFVAVAPRANKPVLAFAGAALPYAVLVTGEVREMLGGDLDPGQSLDTLQTYRFDTSGAPTSVAKLGGAEAHQADWGLAPNGYVFHAFQPTLAAHGGLTVTYKVAPSGDAAKLAPPTKRIHEEREELPADRASYPVRILAGYNHWGRVIEETTAGYRFHAGSENTLTPPSGRPLTIPKGIGYFRAAPNVIAAADGRQLLLVWRAATLACDPAQTIPGRYKLARVFPETGEVIPLGEGAGAGFGAFGSDGKLYVQRDRRVFQLSDDSKTESPLPEGVLFVPPLIDAPECGF